MQTQSRHIREPNIKEIKGDFETFLIKISSELCDFFIAIKELGEICLLQWINEQRIASYASFPVKIDFCF
jgi:hypothetical protein